MCQFIVVKFCLNNNKYDANTDYELVDKRFCYSESWKGLAEFKNLGGCRENSKV